MDAWGNKLSPRKIPDQCLKKTKVINFLNSDNFGLKKNSEIKSILQTLKKGRISLNRKYIHQKTVITKDFLLCES